MSQLKPLALALAIVLGVIVQSHQASSQDLPASPVVMFY